MGSIGNWNEIKMGSITNHADDPLHSGEAFDTAT